MQSFWRRPASPLIASGVVFALLVADIVTAKVQVMSGSGNPEHLGEVGQFVTLLVAIVLFVIGTLRKEAVDDAAGRSAASPAAALVIPEQGVTNKNQGGNQNA